MQFGSIAVCSTALEYVVVNLRSLEPVTLQVTMFTTDSIRLPAWVWSRLKTS